ncbi:MAG: HAD family hydrolase [Treponema sp.]
MKYRLAIFDLDGTILNTLDDIADSCNFILEKNNFPVHTVNEIKYFVGNGIPKLIERALPEDTPPDTKKEILNQFIEYYGSHATVKTCAYDGITSLLENLKANKVHIAVNTNKHEQTSVDLCTRFFPGLIDIVCGGRPDVHHKPDPAGVEKILAAEKVEKSKAVFIGDSDVDIATARNAGIDSIGAGWGFRGKDFLIANGASKVAMTPQELLQMILG